MSKILDQVSDTTANKIFHKCLSYRAQLLYLQNLNIIEPIIEAWLKYYEFTARSISRHFNWSLEEDTTISVDDLEFPAETILEFMLEAEPSNQQLYDDIENNYQLLNQFVVNYYQNAIQFLSSNLSPEGIELIEAMKLAILTWKNSTLIENNLDISSNLEITQESQGELYEGSQENIQIEIDLLEQEFFESAEDLEFLTKKRVKKPELTLLAIDENTHPQSATEIEQEAMLAQARKQAKESNIAKRQAAKEQKKQELAQLHLKKIEQRKENEQKEIKFKQELSKRKQRNTLNTIYDGVEDLFDESTSNRKKIHLRFSKLNIHVDGEDELTSEESTTITGPSLLDELNGLEEQQKNAKSSQVEEAACKTISSQQAVTTLNDELNKEVLDEQITGESTALIHRSLSKEQAKSVSKESHVLKLLHVDDNDKQLLNLTRENLNDALGGFSLNDVNKLIAQLEALQTAFKIILANKNNEYPAPDRFYIGSHNTNLHDIQLKHITLLKSAAAAISMVLVKYHNKQPQELFNYAGELIKFNVTRFKMFTKQENNWFLSKKTKTEKVIWEAAKASAKIAAPVLATNRTALTA